MSTKPGFSSLSLSGLAIRKQVATLMLTIAVAVLGIFFIFSLQVDLLPAITYPRIGVRIDAPGVAPEVAVTEITQPLEAALSSTAGVVQVFSETREGRIQIDLYFRPGGNIDQALNDATATLNRSRNLLPSAIESPRLFKVDPSQLPVTEFALTSPSLSPVALRVFADEELARELSVVPGVATVDVSGGVQEEVLINLDLQRLQALNLGLTEVLEALPSRNLDISGGRIVGSRNEPLTRTKGLFNSVDEIKNLAIPIDTDNNARSAQQIDLQDIATISDGTEEQRVFVTLNGENAVKLSVQKQPEANTVEVIDRVKVRLRQLQEAGVIPEDSILTPTLDESIYIRRSIRNVALAGLSGTLLAGVAVLLFLGSVRQMLIVMVAIPLATLTAIILMKLFGLSLNLFSLGGLALGVGIVVDSSIVMLETIVGAPSNLQQDEWIEEAIARSQTVESALIAASSTNLVAVIPFLLIGGIISLIFNELILTISFAIAASSLIALTVVPMLTAHLQSAAGDKQSTPANFWTSFNQGFIQLQNTYQRLLKQILRYKLTTLVLVFAILSTGTSWMFGQIPQEIIPPISSGNAFFFAQFPPGTSLATNQRLMVIVDQILQEQPETEYAFTSVGGFLFGNSTIPNPLRSASSITLKPGSDVDAFVERVSQEFEQLNLVNIRLGIVPGRLRGLILNNSPLRRADLDLILSGNNPTLLEKTGKDIVNLLEEQATLARFRADADPRQVEIQIQPDWQRVAQVGLTAEDVGTTVQTALTGAVVTELQRQNRLIDVRVKLAANQISTTDQLQDIPLFIDNNRPIRMGDVAQIIVGESPTEIQRINQRPVFLIAGNLADDASLTDAYQELQAILNSYPLPEGVSILPSATIETNRQLQRALLILGSLAAFLVFVVMAVQYNSLIDPLVILFTLPLALAGAVLGLYLTQTSLGATVIVGIVLLVGIIVNNAIIMVEFANQLWRLKKITRQAAILEAAPQRLRPILMTTLTTVLGMLPLAVGIGAGSELLQPLGIVVFSGLLLGTLLTLFVIPCFYVLLHSATKTSH